jgi:hypothetical protein
MHRALIALVIATAFSTSAAPADDRSKVLIETSLGDITLELDQARHGGAHIDRYRKNQNVGRYQLDGTCSVENLIVRQPGS